MEEKKLDFEFKAKVIKGEGRGRKIGFPTANLDKTDLPLDFGVYQVQAFVGGNKYLGLLHYGFKKTFNNQKSTELLIKNFKRDIYGEEVAVIVLKRIRDIRKFKGELELKRQIAADLENIQ